MALYKVEICGVNTAKLPLLKEEEKEERGAAGQPAGTETCLLKNTLRPHDPGTV